MAPPSAQGPNSRRAELRLNCESHSGRIVAAIPLHPADGIRPFKSRVADRLNESLRALGDQPNFLTARTGAAWLALWIFIAHLLLGIRQRVLSE